MASSQNTNVSITIVDIIQSPEISEGEKEVAPSNEVASIVMKLDKLETGSSAVLTINNKDIAITEVVVDVKNAISNVEIKVVSLVSNPIAIDASSKVYQYLQITKSNIDDTDASKITLNFRVPKSWLTSNNVAENNVALYRYSDNKWNSLPTTKSEADANNIMYSAVTPGFSTFAIGSKEAVSNVTPSVEEKGPEEVLFDVEINLITKEVFAGDKIKAEIELLKIAGEKVDVDVFSSIRDSSNNIIVSKHQIVGVETRTSFIRELEIPSNIKPGTYTFHIEVMYDGQIWEAIDSFRVIKKLFEVPTSVILGMLITSLLLSIIILYYEYIRIKKMSKFFKRVTEENLIKGGYIKK
ncbi:MAG: PGF-pre-PGF domain-containing protein [Nanoarchaeota archaeon]